MSATRAFSAQRYELPPAQAGGPAVTLTAIPANEADRLGRAFADIDPWRSYPYPPAALAAYLGGREPHAPRFGIETRGALAGALGLRLDWLRGPYLQFLGILPGFQGLGLGAVVLDWMQQEARRDGARNLWVCASQFNAGALRF